MSPRYAVYGVCALLAALALAWGIGDWQQGRGARAEVTANIESGVASVHQQNAQAQAPILADLQAQHKADQANLDRLNVQRNGLLRRVAELSHVSPATSNEPVNGPVGPDDPELELLRATVAKDAEVIEAQEILIKNQSEQILVATKRGDEWKATAEARERQALAQEVATKAWKDAVVTSRWRGRVEGFAVGLASGYVAGRLK